MANTSPQQQFNPFSAFPAQDRTKIEIIEAWLNASREWRDSALRPNDLDYLKKAFYALIQWYILVHGYTQARKNAKLNELRNKLRYIPDIAAGRKQINDVITVTELGDYQLFASEYMYSIGVTDILQYHRPDEHYIVAGQAER